MEELELTLVGSAVISMIVQWLKNTSWFSKFNARYITVGVCVLGGVAYALSQTLVPREMLENLVSFGVMVWAGSTGLYKLQKSNA